jgi:hypothetical protein
MIFIKSEEVGYGFYEASRDYNGKLVIGACLGHAKTAGGVSKKVLEFLIDEVRDFGDDGCDYETGWPVGDPRNVAASPSFTSPDGLPF